MRIDNARNGTEQGPIPALMIAATQIVSAPTDVAIFGIAADETGVVAGQAFAAAEGAAYEVVGTDGEDVAVEAGVAADEGAVVVDAQGTIEDEGDDTTVEEEGENAADEGEAS